MFDVRRNGHLRCVAIPVDIDFLVEALENRHLLSGIVKLTFNNGTLKLTGDDQDNRIVFHVENPDTLRITGELSTELSVNGVLASTHTIPIGHVQITNLKVNLRAGNDDFYVTQNLTTPHRLIIERDVRIQGGKGDSDDVILDLVDAGRNVTVTQTENCRIYAAQVGHDLRLIGSNERDDYEVTTFVGQTSFVAGTFSILTKGYDDNIVINGIQIGSPSSAGSLIINAGSGNDDFYDAHTLDVWGKVAINMGGGDDDCFIDYPFAPSALNLFGNLTVKLGSGNDALLIGRSSLDGTVNIVGGSGADYVYLHDTDVGDALKASLGGDADAWHMHDIAFLGPCSINGAAGSDWIFTYQVGGTTPVEMNFEYQALPGDFWGRFWTVP